MSPEGRNPINMLDLTGKTVLVTGGARRIGKSLVMLQPGLGRT